MDDQSPWFYRRFGADRTAARLSGPDYEHSKELFQLSVASCEKSRGYAAKLDVVDTYDLLEDRASVLTERPWVAACANCSDGLYLAFRVTVKLIVAGTQPLVPHQI
jgi:hypothetical protein